MGMSREFQEKLFTAFEREDNLRVHKTQGTGLGLAISKYIVDAMEGSIDVTSAPGKGTCFHVQVDLKQAISEEEERRLPPWRILVVDTDPQICQSAEAVLRALGARPATAPSWEEALLLSRQEGEPFFAILAQSELTGAESAVALRKIKKAAGEPILLFSGYDRGELEARLGELGGKQEGLGLVLKPFFPSSLYQALMGVFEEGEEKLLSQKNKKEYSLKGKHILLAEDNEINAEIARTILEESGARVEWAQDGQLALKCFEASLEGTYDAILMDLRMPRKNGYEATQAIRSLKRKDAGTVPIIAMTADAFAEDVRRCLEAGMNAHLSKPIHIEQLKSTLLEYSREGEET